MARQAGKRITDPVNPVQRNYDINESIRLSKQQLITHARQRLEKLSMKMKVVLEPSDEGGYTDYVPSLPGCISEGNTK
jgi:hypothetical protein